MTFAWNKNAFSSETFTIPADALNFHVYATPKPFVPSVGDRVALPTWEPDRYVDVEWVGHSVFAGTRSSDGFKTTFNLATLGWRLWTEPKPKQYVVELRPPRPGDRYLDKAVDGENYLTTTWTLSRGSVLGGHVVRPVIVGEQ